jgi:hypothetical protein
VTGNANLLRGRRRARLAVGSAALALAGAWAGCASSRVVSQPGPASSSIRTVAGPIPEPTAAQIPPTTSPTSRPPTPTTPRPTTPPPARLGAPAPITPLVAPAQAGEGIWQPVAGDRVAGGYPVYTTEVRPAAGYQPTGIAWIDSAATRLSLYAGTTQPHGIWPQQGAVAVTQLPTLLAAFNSGFKIYDYRTGWYDQGRSAMALQAGAASLVIYANGSATVADWGRDATLGPNVLAVRQNLTLLVDHGVAAPNVTAPSQWGEVLGGGPSTWRSALGVTASADLVYVGGPELTPDALARLLIAAGAVRAMELDINPDWVSFSTYTHAGGFAGAGIIGAANLLGGMSLPPGHYLQPFSRDFFAVFAR